MSYERGVLQKADLNELQERLLTIVLMQNKTNEFKEKESEFERQLMIHRPDVWQKIQEEREEAEAMGFDEIVWKTPETIEEFEELERVFQQLEGAQAMAPVRDTSQESPIPVVPIFDGIDLSLLGEDE